MTARSCWVDVFATALASVAVLVLCFAVVVGSTPDEEDFRFAVLSAWLLARGPWTLDSAFWTPALGLGMPQPLVPSFSLHPLTPLLAWMPPIAWVSLFLIVHTAVGAIGMWRLGRVLAFPAIVQATGVVTFLFAAPVRNYVLTDFWPVNYVGWTLVPWIVLLAWRVIDPGSSESRVRRSAGWLGFVSGIAAATAHLAYLAAFVPLTVLVAASWRTSWRRTGWLAVAALIAVAIAAPVFVQLITESSHFDRGLERIVHREPHSIQAAVMEFGYPFTGDQRSRTLSFGAPYSALTVVGCAWFLRQRPDLVLGLLVSMALLFTSWLPMPLVSQRYWYRDPVTLCGILLAGLVLSRIMVRRRARWIGLLLVGLQLAAIGVAGVPAIASNFNAEGRAAVMFRGAVGDTPLMDTLVDHMPSRGRLLYSPQTGLAVERLQYRRDGLGVLSPAYRGILVVNGLFKGVSADTVSPAACLFCGEIRTPRQLVESDGALDVLAIRYVLAFRDERVAPGLRPVATIRPRGEDLVLYENVDAWPPAFLVPATVDDAAVQVMTGCEHDRLICRDLGAIVALRESAPLEVTRAPDHFRVLLAPPSRPSLLVVSEMFRPGWTATLDGQRLTTQAVFGGLIGVALPGDGKEVILQYRPRGHRFALAALLAGIAAAAGFILTPANPRTRLDRPADAPVFSSTEV